MNKIIPSAGLALLCAFTSCKTNDVEDNSKSPIVTLSSEALAINEDLGSTKIVATLASPAVADVVINISVTGTASADDYALDATEIIIAVGDSTGSISITATQDTLEEGNETVIFTIADAVNATVDGVETIQITIEDDDVPFVIQLLLNEILYDPSNSGLDGDANGDGVYAQAEDEFVEIVNMSTASVDISGYALFDAENLAANIPNHTFPTGTIIPSGGVIVVFGGGTPSGTFGGAIVQTSTSGDLNLNNAGDILTMLNADGAEVLTFDIEPYSNNPNESYTRDPDLSGDFVQHSSISSALFSPGTRADGTNF